MRTYELAIVADPRLSDEEFVALVDETKALISSRGGELVREEVWGKRKLAYPIRKITEGQYTFLYLQMEAEKASLFSEVELRLKQNDKILRYLTVRTDLDMKRATNRTKPGQPVKTMHSEPSESHHYDAESSREQGGRAAEGGAKKPAGGEPEDDENQEVGQVADVAEQDRDSIEEA